MINFTNLDRLEDGLPLLSRLIDYPEKTTYADQLLPEVIDQYPKTDQKAELVTIVQELSQQTHLAQQEHYAALFEMNKRYPLYMSYYRMADSRERGVLLAKLNMLYEMFGVSVKSRELVDYLPMLLEFLVFGRFKGDSRNQDVSLAFQVIEDGTYHLLKNAAAKIDDPYIRLVRVIRNELRGCVEMEGNAIG